MTITKQWIGALLRCTSAAAPGKKVFHTFGLAGAVVACTWALGACHSDKGPGDVEPTGATGGPGGGTGGSGTGGGGDPEACADELAANPNLFLVDPENCGTCGHDCLGGGCISGLCQPVRVGGVPGSTYGLDFILWNNRLYWKGEYSFFTEDSPFDIFSNDIEGEAYSLVGEIHYPDLEYDPNQSVYFSHYLFTVNENGVYAFTTSDISPTLRVNTLQLLPHTGGTATVLAEGLVYDLAVGTSSAYFRRFEEPSGGVLPENLYSIPSTGGAPKFVAALGSMPLKPDGSLPGIGTRSMVVHDGFLYMTTRPADKVAFDGISRLPEGGGSLEEVVGGSHIYYIRDFVGEDMFYIQGPDPRRLMQLNMKTGETATIIDDLFSITDINHAWFVIDSESVYFIDPKKGLMRLERSTGKTSILVPLYPGTKMTGLFQVGPALYFTVDSQSNQPQDIIKLAK